MTGHENIIYFYGTSEYS